MLLWRDLPKKYVFFLKGVFIVQSFAQERTGGEEDVKSYTGQGHGSCVQGWRRGRREAFPVFSCAPFEFPYMTCIT